MFDEDDGRQYRVVINHEEQYSVWPADQVAPAGWQLTGPTGVLQDCLSWISAAWTDMRPLSLRHQMTAAPAGKQS
jgi:MbtH protein